MSAPKLTAAQVRALGAWFDDDGNECCMAYPIVFGVRANTLSALQNKGVIRYFPYARDQFGRRIGMYKLTPAGRAALAAHEAPRGCPDCGSPATPNTDAVPTVRPVAEVAS